MGQYIIPALAAIAVAIVEAIASKERKRTKKENEKADARAALRAEESRLSMRMMSATLQLSIVSANALTDGHNNGNVAKAKEAAEEAMAEYEKFVQRVAARKWPRGEEDNHHKENCMGLPAKRHRMGVVQLHTGMVWSSRDCREPVKSGDNRDHIRHIGL